MHLDQYWNSNLLKNRFPFDVDRKRHLDHNRFHDNCFCPFPDRTVEFGNLVRVGVMGFKLLAAACILRFKDLCGRLHATIKASSFGILLLLAGVSLFFNILPVYVKSLLIIHSEMK
jgi:hypothetical protein